MLVYTHRQSELNYTVIQAFTSHTYEALGGLKETKKKTVQRIKDKTRESNEEKKNLTFVIIVLFVFSYIKLLVL